MNRLGAKFGGAVLLVAVSFAGPAYADPTPSPVLPSPVLPSPVPPSPVPPSPAPPGPAAAPDSPGPLPGPAPDPADPQSETLLPLAGTGDPVKDACDQFAQAVNLGATTYEEFADASEGPDNRVNYGDPEVDRTSLISRAALRTAAGAALDAANTPGLPPEISDPMRSWSLHATKLIFILGLHAGRETMNNAVTQLNVDYGSANQACAVTMAHRG